MCVSGASNVEGLPVPSADVGDEAGAVRAELPNFSGGCGVLQVLTHLFNTVLSARPAPSGWRKGASVSVHEGGFT